LLYLKTLIRIFGLIRKLKNKYPYEDRGCGMVTDVELMQWIEHFGRWNVQEFVAKRQDRGM
jgi:hypothetical protein